MEEVLTLWFGFCKFNPTLDDQVKLVCLEHDYLVWGFYPWVDEDGESQWALQGFVEMKSFTSKDELKLKLAGFIVWISNDQQADIARAKNPDNHSITELVGGSTLF